MNEIIDLSELDESYNEATVEPRSYDSIPDGKYQVQIDRAELKTTKTTGKPMLAMTLVVISGEHSGRLLFKNNVLSIDKVKWIKQDMLTCGLDLQKLSDLGGRLEELIGITLEVTKRTKGDNENVYLNKRIEISVEDDLPF